MILAALSLAVWAGLHFYQRSQHSRGRSEPEMNEAPLDASIIPGSVMILSAANQTIIKPKTIKPKTPGEAQHAVFV